MSRTIATTAATFLAASFAVALGSTPSAPLHARRSGGEEALSALKRGDDFAAKKDVEKASAAYKEAIRLDPDLMEAHQKFLGLYERTPDGKYEDYLKTQASLLDQYKGFEKEFPNSTGVAYGLGSLYYNREMPEAKPYLLKVVKKNPKMAEVYEMLAIDACRWGDYPQSARYEKMAWDAEPTNFTYARHYALCLIGRDRGEWKDLARQVEQKFTGTEEGAQALGWLGTFSETPQDKEAGYQEQLAKYPADKFTASKNAIPSLAMLYASTDPAKALDYYNKLSSDKEMSAYAMIGKTYAQAFIDAQKSIDGGKYGDAVTTLSTVKTGKYDPSGLVERLETLRAQALVGAGRGQDAYDGLVARISTAPTEGLIDCAKATGAKLGKSQQTVSDDLWSAVTSKAKPATDFNLYAYLEKRNISLKDYRGKVVLLTFWFPGCGPCRVEMRHFQPVIDKFAKKDFAYVGINTQLEQDPYVESFMRTTKFSFTPLRDEGGAMAKAYAIRGCPTNFLIDGKGQILYTNFMVQDPDAEKRLELMIGTMLDHNK